MKVNMQEFIRLPYEIQEDVLRDQGIVSTITHTPKQVAKSFMQWRSKQKRKSPVVKSVKVRDNGGTKRALAKQCYDMFMSGASAGDVSKTLAITYANAHYYKRKFVKGQLQG